MVNPTEIHLSAAFFWAAKVQKPEIGNRDASQGLLDRLLIINLAQPRTRETIIFAGGYPP